MHLLVQGKVDSKMKFYYRQNCFGKGVNSAIKYSLQSFVCIALKRNSDAHSSLGTTALDKKKKKMKRQVSMLKSVHSNSAI